MNVLVDCKRLVSPHTSRTILKHDIERGDFVCNFHRFQNSARKSVNRVRFLYVRKAASSLPQHREITKSKGPRQVGVW